MCVVSKRSLLRTPSLTAAPPPAQGKDPAALSRRQLIELKNGRLAMIAFSGMLHHYFITGKGPIQFISGN